MLGYLPDSTAWEVMTLRPSGNDSIGWRLLKTSPNQFNDHNQRLSDWHRLSR